MEFPKPAPTADHEAHPLIIKRRVPPLSVLFHNFSQTTQLVFALFSYLQRIFWFSNSSLTRVSMKKYFEILIAIASK